MLNEYMMTMQVVKKNLTKGASFHVSYRDL